MTEGSAPPTNEEIEIVINRSAFALLSGRSRVLTYDVCRRRRWAQTMTSIR